MDKIRQGLGDGQHEEDGEESSDLVMRGLDFL